MRKFEINNHNASAALSEITKAIAGHLESGCDAHVSVAGDKTRTLDQNKKMWAMLGDISRQVRHMVDGRLQYMQPEDWKDVLTAGLRRNTRIAEGVEGGFVQLGLRTSSMTVREVADLIEFIQWFGAEKGVVWREAKRFA